MKVYCISGLCAGREMFQNLELDGHAMIHLDWFVPEGSETLAEYASRMAGLIPEGEDFVLVGLSMGGMVAMEIARLRQPAALVLISSITRADELPTRYRILGALGLYRCLPKMVWTRPWRPLAWVMGVENPSDREVFEKTITSLDIGLLKWSLRAILTWEDREPCHHIRIHGDRDRVLSCRDRGEDVHILAGAGHFMVLNRAEEVSLLLRKEFS